MQKIAWDPIWGDLATQADPIVAREPCFLLPSSHSSERTPAMDLLAFAKNIADRIESAVNKRAKYRSPFVLSMSTGTSFSSIA